MDPASILAGLKELAGLGSKLAERQLDDIEFYNLADAEHWLASEAIKRTLEEEGYVLTWASKSKLYRKFQEGREHVKVPEYRVTEWWYRHVKIIEPEGNHLYLLKKRV